MKLTLISLVFLLSASNGLGQHDSLWHIWTDVKQVDTVRMSALQEFILGKKYYANQRDSAILLATEIVELAKKSNTKQWLSEGYRLQGLAEYYSGNYEQAILQYEKVLQIKTEQQQFKEQSNTYHTIAVVYRLLGDLPKSLEYNLQALAIRKEIGNEKGVALSLQSMATVYYNQKKLNEALEYALEAYNLSEKIAYDLGKANAAVSLANAHSDLGNYDQALEFYTDALGLYEKLERLRNQATCYDNIGNLYLKLENFAAARQYQEKALALRKKNKDKKGLALSYINLGITFSKIDQFETSIEHCIKALSFAEQIKNQRLIYNACECLYQGYESTGDIKNAFAYYQRFINSKDAVEGVEKTKLIEEIESKYELKEKEALLTQQELDLERQRNRQSNTIMIALLVISLLGILFAFLRSQLQRRRQAAELLAAKEHENSEKLRELDRLKSTFFTNISHEFRTPLTLIMSPLEQMMNGTLKGDPKKYQQIMHRNGQRLQDLINQLLDLSKLESGHFRLKPKEANLSQFLLSITHSFQSLADRKQIQYEIISPPINVFASFDKDVLEKILMNLISNAFKFTSEEGHITVSFAFADDQLTIEIADTGIGIPTDQIDSIFNRFYSAESTSDLQMSSGIGLALTKELVDLHEGQIIVKSHERVGTTFTVSIPMVLIKEDPAHLVPLADQKAKTSLEQSSILPSTTNSQHPLLLLVEDNLDVRSYLKDQLKDQYQIAEGSNGVEGYQMAQQLQPDLVISDVMMPLMDGNQLCKELKTNPITSHIPVILLTAKAERRDKIEGLETGADAYLTKPFDHAELQVRIHQLIEQRRLLREKFKSDFRLAPSEVTLTSIDADFLEKIRSQIETNLEDETFSVVELSKSVGMSRSNLFRKLKALTGQSPNQVIKEMRLIRAKELLEKRVGNAAEVAYMVGFNSATYFTKCFGDYFGVSPSKVKDSNDLKV